MNVDINNDNSLSMENNVYARGKCFAASSDGESEQVSISFLSQVCDNLQNNVKIKDRKHRLKLHKSCFVGRQAVDYLLCYSEDRGRSQAVALGQELMNFGLIYHVTHDRAFQDSPYIFYRFTSSTPNQVVDNSFSSSNVGSSISNNNANNNNERGGDQPKKSKPKRGMMMRALISSHKSVSDFCTIPAPKGYWKLLAKNAENAAKKATNSLARVTEDVPAKEEIVVFSKDFNLEELSFDSSDDNETLSIDLQDDVGSNVSSITDVGAEHEQIADGSSLDEGDDHEIEIKSCTSTEAGSFPDDHKLPVQLPAAIIDDQTFLSQVCENIQEDIPVKDWKYRLKSYPQCFVGSQAVDYLCNYPNIEDRSQALAIGQQVMNAGIFYHVTHDRHLEDDPHVFYRFTSTTEAISTLSKDDSPTGSLYDLFQYLKQNVPVRDRSGKFEMHEQCFVGADAVDFMCLHDPLLDRNNATRLGQAMMEEGMLRAVDEGQETFFDSFSLYQFTEPDGIFNGKKLSATSKKRENGVLMRSLKSGHKSISDFCTIKAPTGYWKLLEKNKASCNITNGIEIDSNMGNETASIGGPSEDDRSAIPEESGVGQQAKLENESTKTSDGTNNGCADTHNDIATFASKTITNHGICIATQMPTSTIDTPSDFQFGTVNDGGRATIQVGSPSKDAIMSVIADLQKKVDNLVQEQSGFKNQILNLSSSIEEISEDNEAKKSRIVELEVELNRKGSEQRANAEAV